MTATALRLENIEYELEQILSQIVDEKGEIESGAYGFYNNRLRKKELIAPYEKDILDYCLAEFEAATTFFELGGGIGTLCVALAALGYRATNIEADRRRVELSTNISSELGKQDDPIGSNFAVVKMRFGHDSTDMLDLSSPNILIATNMINSWTDNNRGKVIEELSAFDNLIVDFNRFGRTRSNHEAGALIKEFADWHVVKRVSRHSEKMVVHMKKISSI